MTIHQLVFYFFSTLAILASCLVVGSKNPVRAVLFLIFTFFCTAAIWLLLQSEFLAIVLVLVYVGAVMVLFLFVVMMLDVESKALQHPFIKMWPLGLLVAMMLLGLMVIAVGPRHFGLNIIPLPPEQPAGFSNVKVIGNLLYSEYLFPFEVAGVILLVAMIAAIGLTFRGPRHAKTQKLSLQAQVRKEDRLTVIHMPAEKEGKS